MLLSLPFQFTVVITVEFYLGLTLKRNLLNVPYVTLGNRSFSRKLSCNSCQGKVGMIRWRPINEQQRNNETLSSRVNARKRNACSIIGIFNLKMFLYHFKFNI